MIKNFACDGILEDGYAYSPSGEYVSVGANSVEEYLHEIEQLPNNASPEVFGFHENAEITCATADTLKLCTTILALQPRMSGGAGMSREDTIDSLAVDAA